MEGLDALWNYNRWKPMSATVLKSFMDGNRVRMDGEVRRGRLNALSGVISGLAMASTLFFSAQAVASGQLEGIYLLSVALIVLGIMEAVQPLPLAVSYYYHSVPAIEDMLEVTEGKPTGLPRSAETAFPHQDLPLDIEFVGVDFTYPTGKKPALQKEDIQRMVKVILGDKGSGNTKELMKTIGEALAQAKGSIVCIEKGNMLTTDINYRARLISTDSYEVKGYASFYGFLAGVCAGDHDITDILIDATLRIGGRNYDELASFLEKVYELSTVNEKNFVFTVSADKEELPAEIFNFCKCYED